MDIIFYNGKIMTVETDNPQVEALCIRGNKIEKVGSSEAMLSYRTPETKVIDLGGKLMLPGFIDTHLHLNMYSQKKRNVDLVGSNSLAEINERIKAYIEKHQVPAGQWVMGEGWNQDIFLAGESRFPNKTDLDKASLIHPIAISRNCYHIVAANSLALEKANITATTKVEGGQVDLGEDGAPNGVLRETAGDLITNMIRDTSSKTVFKDSILFILPYLHEAGITSVHSDDIGEFRENYPVVLEAYKELEAAGKLTARIYLQSRFYDPAIFKAFLEAGHLTGRGSEKFKIGPLKLLGDGSLGARTAALSRPYADDPTATGILIFTPEEFEEMIEIANDAGMQTATHCIGDRTAAIVEEAIRKALEKTPRKDHRHAIIHAQINTKETLENYAKLNIGAQMQPIFIDYDAHIVEDRVGKELAEYSYDVRKFLDLGVHVSFGSDAPVEDFNAIQGIYHAVTMKTLDGFAWGLDKRISVSEAVHAFTLAGAYTAFEENIKGSIKEGKLADLVVLSEDIYSISPDTIKDVVVDMTIFDGDIVFERQDK